MPHAAETCGVGKKREPYILKYDYRAYLQTVTVTITKAAFIPTLRYSNSS